MTANNVSGRKERQKDKVTPDNIVSVDSGVSKVAGGTIKNVKGNSYTTDFDGVNYRVSLTVGEGAAVGRARINVTVKDNAGNGLDTGFEACLDDVSGNIFPLKSTVLQSPQEAKYICKVLVVNPLNKCPLGLQKGFETIYSGFITGKGSLEALAKRHNEEYDRYIGGLALRNKLLSLKDKTSNEKQI